MNILLSEEVRKYPLLSFEEEKNLVSRMKKGDRTAKEKLIKSNLRLIDKYINLYINRGLEYDDLFQEGLIGLMRATEKYDPNQGNRFSTYATYWIKQSLQRSAADKGRTIRLPSYMIQKGTEIYTKRKELEKRLNRTVSDQEMAEELGVSINKYIELENYFKPAVSLDTPMSDISSSDDGCSAVVDFVKSDINTEEQYFKKELTILINKNLNKLSKREREIIKLRFGFYNDKNWTLEEISNIYNLTRERIRQIEKIAIQKLRNYSKNLKEYCN